MTIYINGRETGAANGLTIAGLLAEKGLKAENVVVEHNAAIVPQALWPDTIIHDGDKLEIVTFVGGG